MGSIKTKNLFEEIVVQYINEKNCSIDDVNKLLNNDNYYCFNDLKETNEKNIYLHNLNEKTPFRKELGRYYTPRDVVRYMVLVSICEYYGYDFEEISSCDKLINVLKKDKLIEDFLFKCSFLDPTCGTGEFLIEVLELKLSIFLNNTNISASEVSKLISTIFGNDVNRESIDIFKFRIIITLNDFGIKITKKINDCINNCCSNVDFFSMKIKKKFSIVIGNPPYVEYRIYKKLNPNIDNLGNIYANVLIESKNLIEENGVVSFVLPLSFVTTQRMFKIRENLESDFSSSIYINFSDRPDSLFINVHQKLSLVFFSNNNKRLISGYNIWYKNERSLLFDSISLVNRLEVDGTIFKTNNRAENNIITKVIKRKGMSFSDFICNEGTSIFVNQRNTFWIKAFDFNPGSSEYKELNIVDGYEYVILCLLNSSLFWFYWITVSDCWHLTNKDLSFLTVPDVGNIGDFKDAYNLLKKKLEETKEEINTKQSKFAYKHKNCMHEINIIDDLIYDLYRLTKKERQYISKYKIKYRLGQNDKNR